jgi:hypothetical protein
MEEAWARGLGIMIEGEPGAGKTRLAQDFLRSRAGHQILYFQGRPGDADVPYATHARNYRQTLEANPDLDLPEWVVRELARMLPELAERVGGAPRPWRPRRTSAALRGQVRGRAPGGRARPGRHLHGRRAVHGRAQHRGGGLRRLALLGRHEHHAALPVHAPHGRALALRGEPVGRDVRGGRPRAGLPPAAWRGRRRALLADLDVPEASRVGPGVARATGGNAQFVLEAVKSMYEGDSGAPALLAPRVRGISGVIEERLARLSPGALQAARAAAVLRRDFTLELVTQVLGVTLLETAAAWEELEDAQVVAGEAFSHDLVHESVLASTSPSVRRVLHRSAARVLAGEGAHPARVAGHWHDGEDPRQAAVWLARAGDELARSLRFTEAHDLYTRALAAATEVGDAGVAAHARDALGALATRAA